MHVAAALAFAALGIPVGAFVNVVVDRTPDRAPLRGSRDGEAVAPRSLAGVPVQPWLLRAGKGPAGEALPARWLHVELLSALVLGAVGLAHGFGIATTALLVLGAGLVAVSVIDLALLRIPDRVTFPTLALSVPLTLLAAADAGTTGPVRGAFVGALAYFGLLLLPHLVHPAGMGFGDVKLALLMGWHLGYWGWTAAEPTIGPVRYVLYALVVGCVLGVAFGVVVAVATRSRGAFPFGPALALGCLAVLLLAP